MRQAHWYKEAILYEVDVETFQDSNDDGVGDFAGLTSRLDYLVDLGVTCLWLNPFYPSPMQDNGYDVTQFCAVHPRYGSLDDFGRFVREAERRELRVIIDLPLNHTSREHAWFQEARQGPHNPYHEYYVWRDTRPADEERTASFGGSPWAYDERARAYYYHSFYDFQPDLNVAHPKVRGEFQEILRFWLERGVSGFRMDAVPFLIHQRELEKPFSVLQELHRCVVNLQPDAVLVGEVNTPPETLDEYFGLHEGDLQLNVLLNFYVCSRVWLAFACAAPDAIRHAYQVLPSIPQFGQWANFLRNHDELSLVHLDEKAQQQVFAAFAPQEHMRAYGRGIRRRLAPMLGGDARRLKLAHSVLLTLPGTPVLYYGDEIGMGEDLTLAERDSVRTPMQWSSSENGGFSNAAPSQTVRPAIKEGPYGYPRLNVSSQQHPGALLGFVRHATRVRRSCPEFGRGRADFPECGDSQVLAHRCEHEGKVMWAIHNFSNQTREVTLTSPAGAHVMLHEGLEHFADGNVRLAPYGLLWLRLPGGQP